MINVNEQELPMRQPPQLKLITGGKGDPPSGGINWLNALSKGTAFSCKRKGGKDLLDLLIVAFKYEKTIILLNGITSERFVVDPEEWCKKYDHWETVGVEEDKEEGLPPKEIEDDSVRAVRPGVVDNDADA